MAEKTLSQLIGEGLKIKAIQRGLATLGSGQGSANVTITAVVMANCFLSYLGSNSSTDARGLCTLRLTTTTNIVVVKGTSGGLSTASWEVIEFE